MFNSTKLKGKICQWNDDKGYGFIEPDVSGPRLFVHISDLDQGHRRPLSGDTVTYQQARGRDGRPRAVKAMLDLGEPLQAPPVQNNVAASLLTLVFCVGFLAALLAGLIPHLIAVCYLVMSLWTAILYWLDKKAARAKRWRISEFQLLWPGLFGGWPGAILAQQGLRHKTQKSSFRAKFWCVAGINLCLLLLWYDKKFVGLPQLGWF